MAQLKDGHVLLVVSNKVFRVDLAGNIDPTYSLSFTADPPTLLHWVFMGRYRFPTEESC